MTDEGGRMTTRAGRRSLARLSEGLKVDVERLGEIRRRRAAKGLERRTAKIRRTRGCRRNVRDQAFGAGHRVSVRKLGLGPAERLLHVAERPPKTPDGRIERRGI